jgi:3-oxoacyl-[acyl-carrier-protein] synthase-1
MPAIIGQSAVLCAGGRGAEQLWATVRAGIACIKNSCVFDQHSDAIQMGLVPEDALARLPPELDAMGLPSSARRMLRLAGPALVAVAEAAGPNPLKLCLGFPQLSTHEAPWLENFLQLLSMVAGTPIDIAESRIFPMGRASTFLALEAALNIIASDPSAKVVVGGVDTFVDLRRAAELDAQSRILGPRVMDGFIPGEGAAFFLLQDAAAESAVPDAKRVFLQSVATIADEGHRYGTAPALGEGLSDAIEKLRAALSGDAAPIACTFAGFNGENFEAKLWGVARLRHRDFFQSDMVMRHPADSIGDTGAAAGAILMALGAWALANGQEGPALVWAASDLESRGCALMST